MGIAALHPSYEGGFHALTSASPREDSRWFKGNSKVNEEDEFEDH